MSLKNKKILLGVTGGIAAYKSAELVRGLVRKGASVHVTMTEGAVRFIPALTLKTLSGNNVACDMWETGSSKIDHVGLARESDIFLIAPATANTIGKIAGGLADNLLTNLALAFQGLIVICPSMNSGMYLNQAVQSNIGTLKKRGVRVIEPESGYLACGEEGIGRLPQPERIIKEVERLLIGRRELSGKRVMVTAGPTRERLDPVRFISNRSSGKMGYAISEAAADRGAEVTLVSGPTLVPAPAGVRLVRSVDADEMNNAVRTRLKGTDVLIMAAAVSDYKPISFKPEKIKKGEDRLLLELEPTPDILEGVGRDNNGIFLVGFAAETGALLDGMRQKMARKNCSLMVGNLVNSERSGFESDENEIVIISDKNDQVDRLPLMSKREAAEKIIDRIIKEMKLC